MFRLRPVPKTLLADVNPKIRWATTCRSKFSKALANEDATSALSRWAFIGDSGNDRACFAAFRTTFGVANVRGHIGSLSVPPQFVASLPMGQGFAEISRAILAARTGS